MLNILVSGASGIVGYGILRSLSSQKNDYKLFGTTIYDDSAALLFCDVFEKAPPTDDPIYFEWLIKIIKRHSINVLIPGIESDMIAWNENRALLENCGVFLLLNNFELIKLCQDKWHFYSRLITFYPEIAIPTYLSVDDVKSDSPIILKPRIGFGSKGIVKLQSINDIGIHRANVGNILMLQPIIGDDSQEFTVSAFFDDKSQLIDYLPLKRKLSPGGFTQTAEVVDINFENILVKLSNFLLPIGPTNFQFRFDGTNFKLLEINPRISSATSIRAKLGFNESLISLNYFINNIIPARIDRSKILKKIAIRYTEEIIL